MCVAHKNSVKLLPDSNENLRLAVMSAFPLIGNCHMIVFPEILFAFKTGTVVYFK